MRKKGLTERLEDLGRAVNAARELARFFPFAEGEATFPTKYQKMKTFGSGNKQVAQLEWENAAEKEEKKSDNCVEHTKKSGASLAVKLKIVHSDGSDQTWPLTNVDHHPAGETKKVTVCYDKEGRPTTVYIA